LPAPLPPLEPIPLPLPTGLFEVLLLASFALHILAVDVAVGGTVLTLVHYARGRREPGSPHTAFALGIARMLPTAIALLVNLGIPPLLFLQVLYGPAFYTSSVVMALPWIAIIPLLIVGYTLSYKLRTVAKAGSPWTLPVGITSALSLLCIGFFLTNNVTLMLRPDAWAPAYAQSVHGVHLNLSDRTLWPRYTHMVLGMLAGAGVFFAALSTWPAAGLDPAFARRAGLRWFAGATAVQLLVGPLVLLAQPAAIRGLFLGGSPALTSVLWSAVLFAVLALGAALRGRVLLPAVLVTVTVAGMVLVRNGVRRHALSSFGYRIADQPVRPDWMTFVVFLLILALGALAIAAMIRWTRADVKGGAR
jgi:hypothetical protein